jgi:hypothetical protein
MTPPQLIDQLAVCQHQWAKRLPQIHVPTNRAYYITISEFGYHFFATLLKNPSQSWLDRFFITIEHALKNGDEQTKNLVVVGLFESLQGQNYHQGPDDLIESRLLPHSLQAWSDLIEGWTGPGIRTVAQWRVHK